MTAALSALRLEAGRLDAFQVFAGHTPSAICSGVASVLCPHEMELAAPSRRCDASLSRMPVGGLSLVKLRYGSEVAVRPEPSSGFVMLQLVLSGWIQVEHAGGITICPADHGLILESLDQRSLRWSADCEQLIIPIQRATLARAAETLTGRPAPARFAFDTTFALDSATGLSMTALARYLIAHPAAGSAARDATGALAMEMLAHHLLLNHADGAPAAPVGPAVPYHLRRAEDFMRRHLGDDIDMEGIAAAAGVSARTLHAAFRRFRGTSPIEWLRQTRLDEARTRLTSGHAVTVAHVAACVGFRHPGRFSSLYRDRFGEPPHATLDRARRSPPA
ncbi:AraC family transcriptional regulator [Sphingomonas flavalba]|uniref:AraC family transcriptional regulator n=1 Tax=Sphingomonas flavalba TaxID=2559804 RepID=UPI0039DFD54B